MQKNNLFRFLQFWCFSRLNDFLQKLTTMRWKRRKVNLFKSRRRNFDRSSYDSLEKNAKIEFFIDEKKKKVVLVNHEFYANVDVILTATRSKFKVFKKLVKHHEFIKRILKKKIKKKKNCLCYRFCDQKNEKKLRWKKKRCSKSNYERNFSEKRKKFEKRWKTFALRF